MTRFGPRQLVKTSLRWIATICIMPLLVIYWFKSLFVGRDRALEDSTEALACWPGIFGRYLRRAFLARVLVRCHPSAHIGYGAIFSKTGARVDENVYVGPRCHIGLAHLERDVLLAAGVHVTSGGLIHGIDEMTRPIREQQGIPQLVRIGEGAWIGSAAVVMADVGRRCVVGAGAVVTKPLPDNVVAVGVPARIVRQRGSTESDSGQPTDS